MARYSVGVRATGAGSTTLPTQSLYSIAGVAPKLAEVAVFNTTATACVYELVTLTTAGTQGAGLTEGAWEPDASGPNATAFHAHSGSAPTVGQRLGILFPLGAAIGSGVIRTFGNGGVRIEKGTGNGFGLLVHTGTGQICDIDWTWDE